MGEKGIMPLSFAESAGAGSAEKGMLGLFHFADAIIGDLEERLVAGNEFADTQVGSQYRGTLAHSFAAMNGFLAARGVDKVAKGVSRIGSGDDLTDGAGEIAAGASDIAINFLTALNAIKGAASWLNGAGRRFATEPYYSLPKSSTPSKSIGSIQKPVRAYSTGGTLPEWAESILLRQSNGQIFRTVTTSSQVPAGVKKCALVKRVDGKYELRVALDNGQHHCHLISREERVVFAGNIQRRGRRILVNGESTGLRSANNSVTIDYGDAVVGDWIRTMKIRVDNEAGMVRAKHLLGELLEDANDIIDLP